MVPRWLLSEVGRVYTQGIISSELSYLSALRKLSVSRGLLSEVERVYAGWGCSPTQGMTPMPSWELGATPTAGNRSAAKSSHQMDPRVSFPCFAVINSNYTWPVLPCSPFAILTGPFRGDKPCTWRHSAAHGCISCDGTFVIISGSFRGPCAATKSCMWLHNLNRRNNLGKSVDIG